MSRGKKSLYSAATAITLTLVNGLFGLIVTQLVILNYGSDFNGINSTANQLINILLIIEGGFTLATNVALFKPIAERDYSKVNSIMVATKMIFLKIGIAVFIMGVLLTLGYSMIIKSDLPNIIIILIFLMTVISTSFNMLYSMKYQILLQTEQKEYVLNTIKIGTLLLSQFLILGIVYFHGHMLLIRFITMVGAILNSLLIGYVCRRSYKFLDFGVSPDFNLIKGTKEVFIQKFTSVIYGAAPIIFISATVGTMLASVYAVYNSVLLLLKGVLYAFINAPRMGFGQLIAQKEKAYVLKVFIQYEYIVFNVMLVLLTTAAALFMPFIELYTAGVTDVNYHNWYIVLLLLSISFFEIIHIPSGNIINVSGQFKKAMVFQIIASITLIIFALLGSKFLGFYGILIAVLLTSILLAILEIVFVHKVYFKNGMLEFFRLIVPTSTLSIIFVYVEIKLLPDISSYLHLVFAGIVLFFLNSVCIILINLIINFKLTLNVFNRLRRTKGF